MSRRQLLHLATALFLATAGTAAAHHGWSWAEGEQTELRGTLREVYIGQPHPTLRVEVPGSGTWVVELAPPGRTAQAGFTTASAATGDEVLILGSRSRQAGERRMKAVRLTVRDRTYDLYPERIRAAAR